MATSPSMIGALPQFSGLTPPDDLAAASPTLQSLLTSSGGPSGLKNVDSMAAANPQLGQILSLMSPGGGLNQSQAAQFGPLFALMMSLQGGGQPTPGTGGK
jgi:hypothetical protein